MTSVVDPALENLPSLIETASAKGRGLLMVANLPFSRIRSAGLS